MLKNVDKKVLILAGLIIILPIFTMLLLVVLQGCTNRGNSYSSYEKIMIKSAERYFKKNDLLPENESEIAIVKLDTLVAKKIYEIARKSIKR